jgi:hypothetical protein
MVFDTFRLGCDATFGGKMSDMGDMYREMREERRELRARLGKPCPICVEKLPKANPSILLPQQICRIHHYRDPRKREK